MSDMRTETVVGIARDLFVEAYRGPDGQWSWFVDSKPNAGIFGTIDALSADEASREPIPGGRSVAAHVENLRWSLAAVNDVARGKPWPPDWSASWAVQAVTAEQWDALRAELRREFELVLEALDAEEDWTELTKLTGVFALAPHAAYHLGAIRQIARVVTARRN